MPIKKHGREYQGLCPFHNEKSPSFTINDEKGFFHCFGCAAHGDAIEFIKRFERLTYPETIELLAREAGIPLPAVTPEEFKKAEAQKTLYDVMEAACQWFERQLASSSSVARDYLEKRGLKPETLRTFRIGYAPDERTALHQHLLKLGFPIAMQAEAGLIIVPESGAPYDRFRGRVIFPIRSGSGKIIAFGGRLLGNSTNKSLPKYLNSPETPLFKKGETLYNLDLAKKSAREHGMAVVMEGYMDVVSVSQSGVGYALATLGTAVTPEHLRLLWQLAKEPVICLDGDAAGLRAMMRATEVAMPLLKPGLSLRFAMLPAGEDPDSYVQKHGKASFERLLVTSRRLSQILWDNISPEYKLDLPEGRAALEDTLKKLSDKIEHPTVRQHYASYFRKQLWSKAAGTSIQRTSSQERSPLVARMATQQQSAMLETLIQRLLNILVKFPQLLHKSHVEETLSRLDIVNASLNALRVALLSSVTNTNIDDREAFLLYLRKELHDDRFAVNTKDTLNLPYQDNLSDNDVGMLWQETLEAYEDEVESKRLEESLGQQWDAENYARLAELTRKRALRATPVDETDVA